jgi:hypothetical protein
VKIWRYGGGCAKTVPPSARSDQLPCPSQVLGFEIILKEIPGEFSAGRPDWPVFPGIFRRNIEDLALMKLIFPWNHATTGIVAIGESAEDSPSPRGRGLG